MAVFIGISAVPTPANANTPTLTVNSWAADTATGWVTYNLNLSGMCASYNCPWEIRGHYVGPDGDRFQKTIKTGFEWGNSTTPVAYNTSITASAALPEITHIEAKVTSGTTTTTTPLQRVNASADPPLLAPSLSAMWTARMPIRSRK